MYSFIGDKAIVKKTGREGIGRDLDIRGNVIHGARNNKFKEVFKARKTSWYERAGIKQHSLERVKRYL